VDPIRSFLEAGARRVDSVLESKDLRIHVLSAVEWNLPDEGFLNVNTPADWKRLQRRTE
jgi:molybdopterin-guanine dinucleotide biosynthesis protein A